MWEVTITLLSDWGEVNFSLTPEMEFEESLPNEVIEKVFLKVWVEDWRSTLSG